MANEAVLRNRGVAHPVDFIVADGAGIEKGTILELTDPRTGAANDGNGDVIAGVAAREKIASDGRTRLAAFTPGCGAIFDMTVASGASVTVGNYVSTSGANVIKNATEAELVAGKALGRALETGSDSEVIQVQMS